MCIVGTDRTLSTGDVCNKIGTYLKALAAFDNNIPFYVALPSSTIDWDTKNSKDIPIEERNPNELSHLEGIDENGNVKKIQIYPKKSRLKKCLIRKLKINLRISLKKWVNLISYKKFLKIIFQK